VQNLWVFRRREFAAAAEQELEGQQGFYTLRGSEVRPPNKAIKGSPEAWHEAVWQSRSIVPMSLIEMTIGTLE
jgi:hypothetical protein